MSEIIKNPSILFENENNECIIKIEFEIEKYNFNIINKELSNKNKTSNNLNKIIEIINKINNNIIIEYKYDIDKNIEIYIVFKHLLKKYNISQKYINYTINNDVNNKKLILYKSSKYKPNNNDIECLSMNEIFVDYEYEEINDNYKIKINIKYFINIDNKNKEIIELTQMLIEELFINIILNIDDY